MQSMKAPVEKKKTAGFLGGLFGSLRSSTMKAEPEMACIGSSMEQRYSKMPSYPKQKVKKEAKPRAHRQGRKFQHEVDTNVISLDLKVLREDAQLAAGDPIFCENCNAVFNMYSKLEEKQKILADIKEVDEDADMEEEKIPDERMDVDVELGEGEEIWKCEF